MKSWRDLLTRPDELIRETIRKIDTISMQIALVVEPDGRLIGTVTDGDIRRALLNGFSLDDETHRIMNPNPTVARESQDRGSILALMKSKVLHQIPIVNSRGCVVGLEIIDNLVVPSRDNWVVLMAGGLGSRLRPLTDKCPKPLLKVGGKPIVENILENFIEHGFRQFHLAVHYKSGMFKEYFGDGSRWGIQISYLEEREPMGTAGALSLLPARPQQSTLVMNADLLTKVSFSHMLDFHLANNSFATMGVREYEFQVPYGVVRIEDHRVLGIDEKPIQRFFVNAGIYVFEPNVLDMVRPNTYLDMPSLFEGLIQKKMGPTAFPIREYWLDIARESDLARAHGDFESLFP